MPSHKVNKAKEEDAQAILIMKLQTPFGSVILGEKNLSLTHLWLGPEVFPEKMLWAESPLLLKAAAQLSEFFQGRRYCFDLPLAPEGTAFQQKIWECILRIPYGETRTYRQVAEIVGRPRACRAVGQACSRNPLAIFIACHRVLGSHGALTGYAGGLVVKNYLLELEAGFSAGRGLWGPGQAEYFLPKE